MTDPFAAFRSYLEATELVLALDIRRDGTVAAVNQAAATRLRIERVPPEGTMFASLVAEPDRYAAAALLLGAQQFADVTFLDADGARLPVAVHAIRQGSATLVLGEPPVLTYLRLGDDLMRHTNAVAIETRERTRRARRLAADLNARDADHWQIAREQDQLPFCTQCRRVHAGAQGWESAGDFLQRTAGFLAETVCADCASSEHTG